MATNFPNQIDSFPDPISTTPLNIANPLLSHANQHANSNDAINAIETKLGVNGSSDPNSIDFKITAVQTAVADIYNILPNIGSFGVGAIVGVNATGVILADSTSILTSTAVGIVILNGQGAKYVATAGSLTLPNWQLITGTSFLSPGVKYYLGTSGMITSIPLKNQVYIGIALSAGTLAYNINPNLVINLQ